MKDLVEDAVGVVLMFALGYGTFLLGYGMGL